MKGGSGSLGEREEEMALLQPRKTLLLKTADKIGAGYCFCLGDCVLSLVPLLALLWGCRPPLGG